MRLLVFLLCLCCLVLSGQKAASAMNVNDTTQSIQGQLMVKGAVVDATLQQPEAILEDGAPATMQQLVATDEAEDEEEETPDYFAGKDRLPVRQHPPFIFPAYPAVVKCSCIYATIPPALLCAVAPRYILMGVLRI